MLSEFLDPKKLPGSINTWSPCLQCWELNEHPSPLIEKLCYLGKKMLVFHRTLGPFHFELLCTRTRKKKEHEKERVEKQKQRSSLVMGINEVTKALERGTVKLVLVCVKILLNFC